MTGLPSVLAQLLDRCGVDAAELLDRLRRDLPDGGAFRSQAAMPSDAGLNLPAAPVVSLPWDLGYLAGRLLHDRLDMTAIAPDDRLRWYSRGMRHALIVVRGVQGRHPASMRTAVQGRDASLLVSHPMIEGAGCIVEGMHGNASSLQITVTTPWVDVPHPATDAGRLARPGCLSGSPAP